MIKQVCLLLLKPVVQLKEIITFNEILKWWSTPSKVFLITVALQGQVYVILLCSLYELGLSHYTSYPQGRFGSPTY